MELSNFINNFASQFEETDASNIKPNTKFKELGEWSSLIALSVIAMVDADYSVKIKGDDIRNSVSIEDLYNIVKSRI